MGIFDRFRSQGERRGNPRIRPCGLVAYYWTGSVSEPRVIRDFGVSGAFVEAPEVFYPGTLIQMALVDQADRTSGPEGRMSVCAKALERRIDGFSVCFPFLEGKERRAMRRFVERLKDHADARLHRVEGGPAEEQGSVVAEVRAPDKLENPATELEKAAVAFHSREAVTGFTPRTEDPEAEFGHKASNGDPARGQALVEFALIIPLLFVLIVNIINFAGFFLAWVAVANAARTGAQYMAMSSATVGAPKPTTAAQAIAAALADLHVLPNSASAVATVCINNNGVKTPLGCSAPDDPEPTQYVLVAVDVTYTYRPFIPLFDFPKMGIHATLPATVIHRQSSMRRLQ
jgi:hypothetical protein